MSQFGKLIVNEAKLMLIIQHYFDTVWFQPETAPLVKGVSQHGDIFSILVADQKSEAI